MAEITTKSPARPFQTSNIVYLVFGLLVLGAYFVGLDLPLVGPDEPRYAQVAREMFDRGDWITPTLGGHTWFEKPALLYWFQISAYKLFGVSEFSARLGPALCGLGTIAGAYLLGIALRKNELAFWLAVVAASSLGILVFAHGASFDIVITFAVTAAMASFAWFEFRQKAAGLLAFFFFIGVGLLAKGLVGIVFPITIVGAYFLLSRRLPDGRAWILSCLGLVITLLVAGLWYAPVYSQNGWQFVDEFIIQHHFRRFLSNKYQHPQPFYFFLWVLPLMTLPWIGAVATGLWKFAKGAWDRQPSEVGSLRLLGLAWFGIPLIFFSLSGSKLPGYILPAVPGLLIFAATWIYGSTRLWKQVAFATSAVTLAATIVLTLTVVPKFAAEESVKPLIQAANERGFTAERVFAVHTTPHGAEFYAAGRLLRDADGNQRKIYSGPELKTEMEKAGISHGLAIVPSNYPDDITAHRFFRCERITSNGELAIYSVELLSGPADTVH